MTAEVRKDGAAWGRAEVTERGGSIRFFISGPLCTDAVYRVWGRSAEVEPILLGVAEPCGEQLVLDRTRTRSELAPFGYRDTLPEEYILSVREPEWSLKEYTGDELIDRAVRTYHLTVERTEDVLRIKCEFDKNTAFPLAFAACLCRVQDGIAVLEWTKKQIGPL